MAAAIPPSAITVCALPSSDLRNHADADAGGGGFDRGAQARASRADHQNIMFEGLIIRHQRILQSVQMPMAHIRTYRSENPTQNRLSHANSM